MSCNFTLILKSTFVPLPSSNQMIPQANDTTFSSLSRSSNIQSCQLEWLDLKASTLEYATGSNWETKAAKATSSSASTILFDNGLSFQIERLGNTSKGIGIDILSLNPSQFPSDWYRLSLPGYDTRNGIALWKSDMGKAWTIPKKFSGRSFGNGVSILVFSTGQTRDQLCVLFPLDAAGFRSSLITAPCGCLGLESTSGTKGRSINVERVPLLAIGYADRSLGSDMYSLLAATIKAGLDSTGRKMECSNTNSGSHLKKLGWCSWNSSKLGKKLSQTFIVEAVQKFLAKGLPLKWILIDDGWMKTSDSGQLQSFEPCSTKFPLGFKGLTTAIANLGLVEVGIWHAQNGTWGGIDPASRLGETYSLYQYGHDKFFVQPESMLTFFSDWYKYLSEQGISFVKVDNQISTMALSNWIWSVSDVGAVIHNSLKTAASMFLQHGCLSNCMCMVPEAFFNFSNGGAARCSEDYFPAGDSYALDGHANAFSHVIQASYNALLFGSLVEFPDFDMFETHNHNGEFHALARTASNGPIYITDDADLIDSRIIDKITSKDGTVLLADSPLLPSHSSLFQLQDNQCVFKMVSRVGDGGIVLVANMVDSNHVSGSLVLEEEFASRLPLSRSDLYVIYEHFTRKSLIIDKRDVLDLLMERECYAFYLVVPFIHSVAVIGLIGKYNSLATIVAKSFNADNTILSLSVTESLPCLIVTTRRVTKVSSSFLEKLPFTTTFISSTPSHFLLAASIQQFQIVIDLPSNVTSFQIHLELDSEV